MAEKEEADLNKGALECHLAREQARARERRVVSKFATLFLLVSSLSFGVREWQYRRSGY